MKAIKLVLMLAAAVLPLKAATVNLSGGFGTGVLVAQSGVNTAYSLEVGGFEGGIFTPFAAPTVLKNAGEKIAGQFVGVGPTSLNGDAIFIRVTVGAANAVLSTTAFFPADVTSALLTASPSFTTSASGSIVQFTGAQSVTFANANQLNFVPVPEPSIALLGALGVLGLMRRRR